MIDPYQTTRDTYNKMATAYQDKFMDLDIYDATYDRFCELVSVPDARIFEIACGPGNITKYLLNKRPDYRIFGTDVAENMIRLAKKNNPTARFEVMDCRDIDRIEEKFDAVLCGFCMPYISKEDCAKLIKDNAALLKNGGILYFSTMEGEYANSRYVLDSSGQNSCFMYFHQEAFLNESLAGCGFELVDLQRQEYKKTDGTVDTDMFFFARKISE